MRDLEGQEDALGGAEDKKKLTPNQVRGVTQTAFLNWRRKGVKAPQGSCPDGKEKSLGQGSC